MSRCNFAKIIVEQFWIKTLSFQNVCWIFKTYIAETTPIKENVECRNFDKTEAEKELVANQEN